MTSGWLKFRRVGNAAARMARQHSTRQPTTKPRGVVAYGSAIVGGAVVLYSVERCYRGQWGGHHVKDSMSAMEPPRIAPYPPQAALVEGITGKAAAAHADLMVCSSEKADFEYMFASEASWGGGGPIDLSQGEEPGTAQTNDKKETKTVNLEQEMLKRRKIMIHGPVDDRLAHTVCMKLMFLEMEDPGKPIEMMINSPGGKVAAGLAIYDWMQLIKSPVHTMCWGRAYSMGAILLAAGEKGHRVILPNSKVMIHQPSVEIPRAVASDILIKSKEMQDTKAQLKSILAKHMEKKEEWVEEISERDYYMKADEAVECGIVDRIVTSL